MIRLFITVLLTTATISSSGEDIDRILDDLAKHITNGDALPSPPSTATRPDHESESSVTAGYGDELNRLTTELTALSKEVDKLTETLVNQRVDAQKNAVQGPMVHIVLSNTYEAKAAITSIAMTIGDETVFSYVDEGGIVFPQAGATLYFNRLPVGKHQIGLSLRIRPFPSPELPIFGEVVQVAEQKFDGLVAETKGNDLVQTWNIDLSHSNQDYTLSLRTGSSKG